MLTRKSARTDYSVPERLSEPMPEAIEQEANRFLEHHLTDGLGGSPKANHHDHAREFSPGDEPHRNYRFVVDLDDLRSDVWSHAEEPAIEDAYETEALPTGADDEQVRALLDRYACPVPFHEVRTRFFGNMRRRSRPHR